MTEQNTTPDVAAQDVAEVELPSLAELREKRAALAGKKEKQLSELNASASEDAYLLVREVFKQDADTISGEDAFNALKILREKSADLLSEDTRAWMRKVLDPARKAKSKKSQLELFARNLARLQPRKRKAAGTGDGDSGWAKVRRAMEELKAQNLAMRDALEVAGIDPDAVIAAAAETDDDETDE